MEIAFRRDLIAWLAADTTLSAGLNAVAEEAPTAAPPPWLGIGASASADWSTKDHRGCEIRVALELTCRGEEPDTIAALAAALERRVATLPSAQDGYRVVVSHFLRSRAERRKGNLRAVLAEYRFLILATNGETP